MTGETDNVVGPVARALPPLHWVNSMARSAFGTGTLLGYGRILWEPIDLPDNQEDPSKARGGFGP